VRNAVAAALPALDTTEWFERVLHEAPEPYRGLIRELGLAPLPVPKQSPEAVADYARNIVIALLERDLLALKGQLVARMQRMGESDSAESRQIQQQLTALETARRALRGE